MRSTASVILRLSAKNLIASPTIIAKPGCAWWWLLLDLGAIKLDGETLVVLDGSGSMSGKPIKIGSLFAAVLIKANTPTT